MHLFVTGAYRSGTTLVEKLLHQHPGAAVASQPFPFLYANVKQAFLDQAGLTDRYPLGHGFHARYAPEQWWAFLERFVVTPNRLDDWIADQSGYSGALTPQLTALSGSLGGGPFLDVHERLQAGLATALRRPAASVCGSKEILCEEYAPPLLAAGHRVVLVIRDVRAILASLLATSGRRYGGLPRPVLFTIRVWRKSVAYALAYSEDPRLRVVRYEDVVAGRQEVLNRLARWLGLAGRSDWNRPDIVDQQGGTWADNSSFDRPSVDSEGQWQRIRATLPEETIRYAEACAYPELLALGYEVEPVQPGVLEAFREPLPIRRGEFHPRYSTRAGHLAQERERLRLLETDLPTEEAYRWFLFPQAHAALRKACPRDPLC